MTQFFTFVPKESKLVSNFAAIEKEVLKDIATNSPHMEWDDKEEVIKTEAVFKEASMELQRQAVAFNVEGVLRNDYLRSLDRVARE